MVIFCYHSYYQRIVILLSKWMWRKTCYFANNSIFYFLYLFRPVTDFNEIASHFIDCIYVHLYNSRLRVLVLELQVLCWSLTWYRVYIWLWILTSLYHMSLCVLMFYVVKHLQASVPVQQHVSNSTQITPTKGYQAQAVPPNQVSARCF